MKYNALAVTCVLTAGAAINAAQADVSGLIGQDTIHFYEADGITKTNSANAAYAVIDVFVEFLAPNTHGYTNADSHMLSAFNCNFFSDTIVENFHQSDLTGSGTGANGSWKPSFSFDINGVSNPRIDSFITIGGGVGLDAATNVTTPDPNLGTATNAAIFNDNVGWFLNPRTSPQGDVINFEVWLGRFVVSGDEARAGASFAIEGTIGYNYGPGTGSFSDDVSATFSFGIIDCNGNGFLDEDDIANGSSNDIDGNGIPDECQPDCNGNSIPDAYDILQGTSGDLDTDGVPDECQADCDGDRQPDAWAVSQGLADDCNGNLIPDICEFGAIETASNEGMPTVKEPLFLETGQLPPPSAAGIELDIIAVGSFESVARFLVVEFEGELLEYVFVTDGTTCGVQRDTLYISAETWNAAGSDGERSLSVWASPAVDPDACSTASVQITARYPLAPEDCNGNGTWDPCDIASGLENDVDGNEIPDSCEPDCDGDAYPDASAIAKGLVPDCTLNGIPDSCDIASGGSNDVDMDGQPDECQIDCNGNGLPDYYEIAEGMAEDCNKNLVPDTCDLAKGDSTDFDSNDVPDDCQPDCDADGYPDAWAIAQGLAPDCNANGLPDFCDIENDSKFDVNGNGIPDSCELARGDLNLDGCVNGSDLATMLGLWGFPDPPIGDLNGDQTIDGTDLATLLSNWDECP